MRDADRTGEAPATRAAPDDWRGPALEGMFTASAILAPLAAVTSIVLRGTAGRAIDTAVLLAVAVLMLLVRLAPRTLLRARAAATVFALCGCGTFVVARLGLAPGSTMVFAIASVFGAVCFGRRAGYAIVLWGGLSFLVVGALVAKGVIVVSPEEFDTRNYQNWVRVGVVFMLISGLMTSAVWFVIKRVEASARDLRVAYERLGQLHLRLESTKENERRFLARELHDELGQTLTALKLQIAARRAGAANADADALALIDDLIARVRRMSGDLRPPLLDEVGLVPALRAFLVAQASLSGVAMTLDADEGHVEGDGRLSPDLEITCFRIVQEAITNAIRHADARDLRVRLERASNHVTLRITDDGRGFDMGVRLESAAADGHLGVVGMRERVRAHGGGFSMRSRPGAGTTIEVELPLPVEVRGPSEVGPAASAALPS
ncbi:MAG TPA: sensor histidine kinase [Polyangia bacterium]|nr:sensor histidine kinase [Polyangia bacterium]